MDGFEADDPYVEPGMPWQRKLLIGVAVLQLTIIGLQVSIMSKTPDEPYSAPSSDVDLSPITYKLDELKSEIEAARSAAADARDKASDAHGATLKVSSDLAMQAITGVKCDRY